MASVFFSYQCIFMEEGGSPEFAAVGGRLSPHEPSERCQLYKQRSASREKKRFHCHILIDVNHF